MINEKRGEKNKEHMKQISLNLPDEKRYLVIKPNLKKPLIKDWSNFNKAETKESITPKLNDYNAGMLLGNGLIAIDCDTLELELAVEQLIKKTTYTQVSAKRGLKHFFFKVKGFEENLGLTNNNKPVGEILGKGRQIIIAPSEINGKSYKAIRDIPIAEITKTELMKVILQFDSKLTKKTQQKTKEFFQKSDIDNLSITSVLSTAGMEQDSRGQYFGSNPFHGSETGSNFWINPAKNLAYCFRTGCDCAISPAKAIALNEGIILRCDDSLKGSDFIKTIQVAKEKYGLRDTNSNEKEEMGIKEKGLKFWSVQDYANYKIPKDHIIKTIMNPSEILMNYGQTGSLKSMNMLYKALCIASGKKYLGKFPTKQKAVAILSAENSIQVDKERLFALKKGLGIRKRNLPLHILPRSNCGDLLNKFWKEALINYLQKHNIEVLFIDTINPMTPEIEDTVTRDVTRLFNNFLKIVADLGISVEFLHHTDKAGKNFLGSMKFKANSDCVTRIERDELNHTFQLFNEKNRSGETNTLTIGFDFISNKKNKLSKIQAKLLDDTAKPQIYQKKRKPSKSKILQKTLIEILPKTDITRKEIIVTLEKEKIEYTTATLDRSLKDLVKDGKLNSVEKGVYQKQ